jgi:CHASE3 domain sensor protein
VNRLFEVPREARPFLASSVISNVVLLLLFAAGSVWFTLSENNAVRQQQAIRRAQDARSTTLRYQLDEETALRGYELTKNGSFLEPYDAALDRMPGAFRLLDSFGPAAGADPSLSHQEHVLNARWLRTVAAPLIASPYRIGHVALERRGKALVDEFRARDGMVTDQLNAASDDVDSATARLQATILTLMLVFGAFVAAVLAWYSITQSRLHGLLWEQQGAYEAEKHIADALQAAFVQERLPELHRIALNAIYVPAKMEAQIGGDWYDAFELPDKRILFSIGDVAGHGLDAAVIMSRVRQAIISTALHEQDPGEVLVCTNAALMLQNPTMVTALCGFIDPQTLQIRYATAGHPPPIVVVGANAAFLAHEGPPLGALDHPQYPTMRHLAVPGSMLVLYTDGVLEYDRDLDRGEKLLLEASKQAAAAGGDSALHIFKQLFGDDAPPDDVAILTARFQDDPLAIK